MPAPIAPTSSAFDAPASFEHVTSFAVSVGARRPFGVLVLSDPGNHVTRLNVDIAH